MTHLSYEVICQVADGITLNRETSDALTHLEKCPQCRQEVDLQRRLLQEVRRNGIIQPSANFTVKLMESLMPLKAKKWFDRILENLGNVIAMASVLAFLGYIYLIISAGSLRIDTPSNNKSVSEFIKIIQDGSHQIINFIAPKTTSLIGETFQGRILEFGLLAILVLFVIDTIIQRCFLRIKA